MRLIIAAPSFLLLTLGVGLLSNCFTAASSQTTEECPPVPPICASLLPYTSHRIAPFFPLSEVGMELSDDIVEGAFELSPTCMADFDREVCALRYPPCPGVGVSSYQVCKHRCPLLKEACTFLNFAMEIDCRQLTLTQEDSSGLCTNDTQPLESIVNSTTQQSTNVTQDGHTTTAVLTKMTDLMQTGEFELEIENVSPSSSAVKSNVMDTSASTTTPVEATTIHDAEIHTDAKCQPVPSDCASLLPYNTSSLEPFFPLSESGETVQKATDLIAAVFRFQGDCMRDFGMEVCALLHPPCPTERVTSQMCAHRCPLLNETCSYFFFLVNVNCSHLTFVQEDSSGFCRDDTYTTERMPITESTRFYQTQTTLGISPPEDTTLKLSTRGLNLDQTYPLTTGKDVGRSVFELGTRLETITPISTDPSGVLVTTLGTTGKDSVGTSSLDIYTNTVSSTSLSYSTALVETYSTTTWITESGKTIIDTNIEADTGSSPISTDIMALVQTYLPTTGVPEGETIIHETSTGIPSYITTIVELETDIDTSFLLSTATPTVIKSSPLTTDTSSQITTALESGTDFDTESMTLDNTLLTAQTLNGEMTSLGTTTETSDNEAATSVTRSEVKMGMERSTLVNTVISTMSLSPIRVDYSTSPDVRITSPLLSSRIHDSTQSSSAPPSSSARVPSTAVPISSTGDLKAERLDEKIPVTIQHYVFEEELMDITMILASPNVTTDEVSEAAEKVIEISSDDTFFSEDPTRVELVISSLESIVNTGYTENVTEPVIEIIDNLMDVDEEIINQGTSEGGRAVAALEELITNVQEREDNVTIVRRNLGVVAVKVNRDNIGENLVLTVTEPDVDDETKQEDDGKFITSLHTDKEEMPVETMTIATIITVPREVIDSSSEDEVNSTMVPVSFIVYGNSRLFTPSMPSTTDAEEGVTEIIVSQVISVRVEDKDAPTKDLTLGTPIIAEFLLNADFQFNESTTKHCVLWDYNEDTREGFWSDERCMMISDEGNHTVCSCDSFASFAILVRVDNGDIVLYYITFVGSIISGICLILCILTFMSLKSLRSKQPTHIHINLCVSLLGFYVSFMLSIPAARNATLCKVASAAIHFFSLATIAWMTAEAVNLYFLFVKMERRGIKYFMPIASVLTYGSSAICVVLTIFLDNNSRFDRSSYCFIQPGNALYFGFLTQVAALFAINFFIFIWVIRKMLCRPLLVTKTNKNARRKEIITRVRHGILFWFILGLSWFFGFLSAITVDSKTVVFDYLYCIFTSLQGLMMFLLLCVANPEFKKMLLQLKKRDVSGTDSSNMTGALTKTRRTSDGHLTCAENSQGRESSQAEVLSDVSSV